MAIIAIVYDERNVVTSLKLALGAEGHIVDGYLDPLVALPKLICAPPQVLILNGRMPGMHGLEFFARFREFGRTPVIFLSASADEIEVELARRGTPAEAYIETPFLQRKIVEVINRVLADAGKSGRI